MVLASLAQVDLLEFILLAKLFFNRPRVCFANVVAGFVFWLLLPKSELHVKFGRVCNGVFLGQSSLAFRKVA